MLLIGSHALNQNLPSSIGRKCMDYDLIATYSEYENWIKDKQFDYLMPHNGAKKMIAKNKDNIFEFEIAWPGSSAEALLEAIHKDNSTVNDFLGYFSKVLIPDLNFLYMIKMSHRFLKNSPHFLKTMHDINLMKSYGAYIPEEYKNLFKLREKETYNYAHPNLSQNKMGFFDPNQGVQYQWNHDDIHKVFAKMENPAYSYYKKDNEEVQCSKEKFFLVDEHIRLNGVYEESLVLAAERSQIPFKGKVDPKWSFLKALEKVCTSITSGYFRNYAYDNYDKVVGMYEDGYMNKLWKAIEEGTVKQFKQSK